MIRAVALILASAMLAPAWVESVEFPWNAYSKPLWERELVWLKNIGITHVSLPPADHAQDVSQLRELLGIIRRLNMEADLEGPVPGELEALTRAHGGPLTPTLPGPAMRISVLSVAATTRSRELLTSGATALLWTDVEDTLGPAGYRAGAVNFAGEESAATMPLRRSAQLTAYWSATFPQLHALPGAGVKIGGAPSTVQTPSVRQFTGTNGVSVVSVVNESAQAWKGELQVFYPALKRDIAISGVSVPAGDSLWLPVNVPLTAEPLCKGCSAFANTDHLIFATAEMTAMEYENGILAMEFAAPSEGEVVLQLSREPYGPLVAGGKPVSFDWDDQAHRARLKIPAGTGPAKRVRIGIGIEPPDETGFFDNPRVLMIGETNRLTAQFSSQAVAQRSRVRLTPPFPIQQEAGKDPLGLTYEVNVPETAVHGDHADLAIEADGMQMSHARPELLRPVTLRFPDSIDVHLGEKSALPLFPATVPVNQRAGRDVVVTLRNNAPEIRNFAVEPKAEGLEFSPAKLDLTVGASTSRDLAFRVFATDAAPGVHAGFVIVTGAVATMEPIQFVVLPPNGEVAYAASGFALIENARFRATFMPGRWLEFINKENNRNLLMSTGVAFTAGTISISGDALVFGETGRPARLADLEKLIALPPP